MNLHVQSIFGDQSEIRELNVLNLYTVFHLNLAFSSIEEEQRPEVVKKCYWPLLRLAADLDVPIGLEATAYTLEAIDKIDPGWITELARLWQADAVEFVGSGYAQIIGPLVPPAMTRRNLAFGNQIYQTLLGQKPDIALVNEQAFAPGLVPLYLEAGYRALVMDWADPASHHPEWSSDLAHRPARIGGTGGSEIDMVWSDAIAFQKFQRYVHGELQLPEYIAYLKGAAAKGFEALCLYGSDAEIIDFRPGRFATEAATGSGGGSSEWDRVAGLILALQNDDEFAFCLPGQALELRHNGDPALSLESAVCPIPVKKQPKYNVARWAVSGRADVRLNSACRNILEVLTAKGDAATDAEWKSLARMWASDLRTHITDSRWQKACAEVADLQEQMPQTPPHEEVELTKSSAKSRFNIQRRGHSLTISSMTGKLSLNLYRGLAITTFLPRREETADGEPVDDPFWAGTVPHGYYDDISWGADFYSGHLTLDLPGEHKITDLSQVEPEILEAEDGTFLQLAVDIKTRLGTIGKTLRLFADAPRLQITYDLPDTFLAAGSLRLGHITLNPALFDRETLYYLCNNGGEEAERHMCGNLHVDHGAPISALVSSSFGLGITGGWLELGDSDRAVRISIMPGGFCPLGLISRQDVGDTYFFRASLSTGEIDETRRLHDPDEEQSLLRPLIGFDIDLLG